MKPDFVLCVNPSSDIAAEVASYADVAKKIIDLAVSGAAQNRSYRRLADFTDTIGHRMSGSHNLEMAIQYMYKAMTQDGLDVRLGESVLLSSVCNEDKLQTQVSHSKGSLSAMSSTLLIVNVVMLYFFLQSQPKSHTG